MRILQMNLLASGLAGQKRKSMTKQQGKFISVTKTKMYDCKIGE